MIRDETKNQEAETPKRVVTGETVLSYVVISCFIVAVLGILGAVHDTNSGNSLLASAVALGVIAYIYRR